MERVFTMKSSVIKDGVSTAPQRSLLNALGLTEEEIKSGAVKEAKEKGYIATEPKKVIVVKGRLVNIIA